MLDAVDKLREMQAEDPQIQTWLSEPSPAMECRVHDEVAYCKLVAKDHWKIVLPRKLVREVIAMGHE